MEIQGIKITPKSPPLIVGYINHNGNIDTAKAIVNHAFLSGIRAICESTLCPLLELEDQKRLKNYIEKMGLIFVANPSSQDHAKALYDIGSNVFILDYPQIFVSANNTALPFLDTLASFKKPLFINIDAGLDLAQTSDLVRILRQKEVDFALLQDNHNCSNAAAARLDLILELLNNFTDFPIGLMDKTPNNNAAKGATALGASIIVKTFTDDKNRDGHGDFMDFKNAYDLIKGVNEIYFMLNGFECIK
ncbi:MAG: N-acetylneuraminate synthase family protein [Helicobacter sp.]|nr:N-acetylneuraminate synthase family protein [Helicobacter sp.]